MKNASIRGTDPNSDELRAEVFADAIAADAEAGRLDFLFDEAESERQKDALKPWPAKD